MDATNAEPAPREPAPAEAEPVEPARLVAPVQIVVRCPSCGYERSSLALHAKALDEALRCERCKQPNEVLAHRGMSGPACVCCSPV